MLDETERLRYARQMSIPGWGEAGQARLKEARVVVAGAGGLGSAVLTYLAVAGVGELRIIDSDRVEPGNLNRQVLHGAQDVGRLKAESARERVRELNPDIRVEPVAERIHAGNVLGLLEGEVVVDALDNLETRLLLNRAALERKLPLVHGAVHGLEGRVTTLFPGETACMQCLYRETVPGETPVAGVAPAVVGSLQAAEVIKLLLDLGELLRGRMLIYDGLDARFREVRLKRDPHCPLCGSLSPVP